ncbi:MAG: DUF4249 family protein [Gemmatimonadales bacterium]|jgi:hypothetical protein
MLLALTGCSTDREPGDLFAPDEVGALVVDATLIVGDELPPVLLSRTLAPGDLFSLDGVAVTGAEVSIRWGSNEAAYNELAPGVYWMPAPPVVRPTTVYHLEVRSTEGEVLTASTTTPRAFSVNRWVLLDNNGESVLRTLGTFAEHGDTLYSAPENQLVYQQGLLEARFDRGDEIAFQIGLSSLDEGSDFVIDPDFFDEEDFEDLERDVASPPFDALDGRIRLPWFAIYFEGRYMVRFYSVDRNWYDLARSLPEFAGGGSGFGGQAGDDFERPLFRVNGGIGLFGSAAVDTVGFTIHPAP